MAKTEANKAKKRIAGLTPAGKEELAIALILWKDWKSGKKMDLAFSMQAINYAEMLGIRQEYDKMLSQIPPMKIEQR